MCKTPTILVHRWCSSLRYYCSIIIILIHSLHHTVFRSFLNIHLIIPTVLLLIIPNIFGPKIFWSKKIFGPKRKFWSEKNFWSEIFFGPKEMLVNKKNCPKKHFWSNKNFWFEKFFNPKTCLVREKKFVEKKICVQKTFLIQKTFLSKKKELSKKNLIPKILLCPKINSYPPKNFGPKIILFSTVKLPNKNLTKIRRIFKLNTLNLSLVKLFCWLVGGRWLVIR